MNFSNKRVYEQSDSNERLRDCKLELLKERDRAIGLEQELLRYATDQANAELRLRIIDLEHSAEIKIGRLVLAPVRLFRKIVALPIRAVRRVKKAVGNRSTHNRISD